MNKSRIVLVASPVFVKQVKKLNKKDAQTAKKLKTQLKIFRKNPYDSRLKTHKLGGRLQGRFAFSVTQDIRVVFRYISNRKILLIAIGTHNQVYK